MKKTFFIFSFLFAVLFSGQAFSAISGSGIVCMGTPRYLCGDTASAATATWSSSNMAVATVAATGTSCAMVTGVSVGTAIISCIQSSVLSTITVTVNPAVAPVTGSGGPICVGATTSLSCATPGGTWSSGYTYVATAAATGIVTGVHGGTANIYYTLSTGCSSSMVVTVSGTPPVDSVTGAASVCVGATTTYSCTTTSGVWSSSNPSVATVSSTGVVTGIAAGFAIISYAVTGSCGTGTGTRYISVISGSSAGTISGASTVGIGLTTTLSSTAGGGTWSSSSTAVATVAASGVVTGVAVGTAVITYSVTGCGGPAYTTTTLTVTTANCISGDVLFSGATYSGTVKVWLIKYNAATLMLTAVDSQVVSAISSGTSAHYAFCGMGTDSFRVKAACLDTMFTGTTTGYQPTYHNASPFWSTASVVYHTAGTHDMGKNITMSFGTVTSGPGFIAGDVTMGANKGTAGGVPAVNMLMYCVNSTTGAVMQKTYTNTLGHYSFSSLPVGQSYKIYPEMINYATTPYPPITLTTGTPSMSVAGFEQHTLSHTITPIISAVNDLSVAAGSIAVFPNPATGSFNVQWNVAKNSTGSVSIIDVTGRQVSSINIDMAAGAGTSVIPVSHIAAGIYVVRVAEEGFIRNFRVEIR